MTLRADTSTPVLGSSNSNTSGDPKSARAIDNFRLLPPLILGQSHTPILDLTK